MDEIQTVVPQGTLAPENLDFNDHLRNMWCQQQMMGGGSCRSRIQVRSIKVIC